MEKKIGIGHGVGKVILFGEHFVVYGLPAIVAGINMETIATVEYTENKDYVLIDNRNETPNYKKEKINQQKDSLKKIFEYMKISPRNLKISLGGDLLATSGIGASAASCVAIARGLSKYFMLGYTDEKINDIAYEGEKGYHGTPSGIDNTAATYSGIIWFKREESRNIFEKIKIKKPIDIVICDTGIVSNTKEVVNYVRKRKQDNPNKFNKIFTEYEKLLYDARKSIEKFDIKKIGTLMNENHKLLQDIGVSSKEIELLVSIAIEYGAYGAKLTGTGKGGNIIALTPYKSLQEIVADAIEKEGFTVIKTTIG